MHWLTASLIQLLQWIHPCLYGLQLMNGLGLGPGEDPTAGGAREPRRNTLASISAYLDNLEAMSEANNLAILLPSLSYPPAQGELTGCCCVCEAH